HGKYLREVHSYYRVGDVTSGSATEVKLQTLKARLLGGNQQAVAILVSAEASKTGNPRAAIEAFVKDMASIDKVADQMAGLD
ncbi:exosortase-associated EpsI family protein, partial [Sphingorhabdus sp.]|uniref:exosortase-associated EpsI family protein n=1 Tax=Sphingorhabdus sp. TaxID=1902408 RepID=UPI003BAED629